MNEFGSDFPCCEQEGPDVCKHGPYVTAASRRRAYAWHLVMLVIAAGVLALVVMMP